MLAFNDSLAFYGAIYQSDNISHINPTLIFFVLRGVWNNVSHQLDQSGFKLHHLHKLKLLTTLSLIILLMILELPRRVEHFGAVRFHDVQRVYALDTQWTGL